MSGRGAWIQADRQERLDRKAAGQRVLDERRARRVAARERVAELGLLDENGNPCSWAIQAALKMQERGETGITKATVAAAANAQKRKAWEWVGGKTKTTREAA